MNNIIPGMLLFLLLPAFSRLIPGCAPLPKTSEIIGNVPADHGPPRIASTRGIL